MKQAKIYVDKRRQKSMFNLFGLIFKGVTDILIPCIKNFIRDVNKHGLQFEGIFSSWVLIAFNFCAFFPCKHLNNFVLYFWLLVISISIFCVWWHIVLEPKNRAYDAMMWQQEQYWWQFNGWEFEEEVAKVFRARGYKADVTKGSGDGGVDIFLYKNGIKTVVQCKHYKEQVSVEPVRALWGCMYHFNADEAIFIASSGFTRGCYDFKMGKVNYIFMTLQDVIKMAEGV